MGAPHEHRDRKHNKGNTIVIMDEVPEHAANLLSLFEQDLSFTDGYTCHDQTASAERLSQIIDVPHFSRSHLAIPIQLADNVAFVVRRHIELTCYGATRRYRTEEKVIADYYAQVGKCLIRHTSVNPPANDSLCKFYREVRPTGWSAKDCRA